MEKYYFDIMGNEDSGWWMVNHFSTLNKKDIENGFEICDGVKYELIPLSSFNQERKKYPNIKLCKSVLSSFIKDEDKYLIETIEDVIDDTDLQ